MGRSRLIFMSSAIILASGFVATSHDARASFLGDALLLTANAQSSSFSEMLVPVSQEAAKGFIEDMSNTGLAFLSDASLSKDAKSAKFNALLTRYFDLNAISKFTVGRYWRDMTPAQQNEYQSLFKDMLVRSYSKRFSEYQGQTLDVTGQKPLSDTETLVESVIKDPNGGAPVTVNWRVRDKGGQMKVIDVIVAGVSMSVTQRSDFSSVIQRGGGDVAVLLDHLRK
tara:strand:+ start:952 stop:1629 length:678 start_codon:yes stop_codon:yes gene_type:complete